MSCYNAFPLDWSAVRDITGQWLTGQKDARVQQELELIMDNLIKYKKTILKQKLPQGRFKNEATTNC